MGALLEFWFEIDRPGSGSDFCVLRFYRVGKFFRTADIDDLAGGLQPLGDHTIRCDGHHIRCDLLFEIVRNGLYAEQPDQTFSLQRRIASLARCGDVR
jgi:hypothetical protein